MAPHGTSFRLPQVLVPYTPAVSEDQRDFFIFLRPESNGVKVESVMMRVIMDNRRYREGVHICYLANIPGDYMVHSRMVEQHYHLKISFAQRGGQLFTPYMKSVFQAHFHELFRQDRVLGAFAALERFDLTPEEMFHLRVPAAEMLEVNGQSIKRFHDHFIVNYDIPAILQKNRGQTDIAVMVLRSELADDLFRQLIAEMGNALRREKIISPRMPVSHVFHYSKGPFEFILDAEGFLLTPRGRRVSLGQHEFSRFLLRRGISVDKLERLLRYPILLYRETDDTLVERDIIGYTFGDGFEEAYQKLQNARGQYLLS